MSRRVTLWRRRNVLGKDATETALNILRHCPRMKLAKAARIANRLHKGQ